MLSPAMQRLRAWCEGRRECHHYDECGPIFHGPNCLCGCPDCKGTGKADLDPTEWAAGLPPLVLAAAERECDECTSEEAHGHSTGLVWTLSEVATLRCVVCPECNGTGKVTLVEHPLPRVALALGWRALTALTESAGAFHGSIQIYRALRAVEAWIEEPSEERLEAWKSACSRLKLAGDNWVPCTSLTEDPKPEVQARLTLADAAKVLGVPAAGRVMIGEVERWEAR